jgi:hypothetical protein
MLELRLVRTDLTPVSTGGELYVNEVWECYTLELPVVDGLPGSAIPPGVYPITLAPSPKFMLVHTEWVEKYSQSIPHLFQIPNRTNILIHWGNEATDTEGCILVGKTRNLDFVGQSRDAFAALHAKLVPADSIQITVMGGIPVTNTGPSGIPEPTFPR